MNIQALKKDVDGLRKLNEEYDRLDSEKNEIDRKLKSLKNDYDEGKVSRDIFGQYNKKLIDVNERLNEVKNQVLKLTQDIDKNAN
tara:strand:+ start:1398 stop:1652 length:255 start_codon:yes stop_codon:yes gene_type:complete